MEREAQLPSSVQGYQLRWTLQQWGVTFLGAQQFATGEVVTSRADRLVISDLMHRLLRHGTVNPMQFGTYDPVEH
jgi:hypothetical protein